jgi:hypothetical protein
VDFFRAASAGLGSDMLRALDGRCVILADGESEADL